MSTADYQAAWARRLAAGASRRRLGGKLTKSDLVFAALRELGGVVDRAVMIGDRHYDANGAHEHGLSAVGVGYGFGTADELESAGADIVCNSVAELRDALFHFIDSC